MHPALQIPDILLSILELVLDRADLLSLLLTCKLFEGSARAALWRCIPHFSVLVRLLPSDVISGNNGQLKLLDAHPSSQLMRYDWVGARFKLHANCVQELDTFTSGGFLPSKLAYFSAVDSGVIDALLAYNNSLHGPCFPRLRVLRYDDWEPLDSYRHSSLYLMSQLLSPNLSRVHLELANPECAADTQDVLKELQKIGQTLACLYIDMNTSADFVITDHARMVLGMHHLTEFTTDVPLTAGAVRHLAGLSGLRHLSATLSSRTSQFAAIDLPPRSFPTLIQMHLSQDALGYTTERGMTSISPILLVMGGVSSPLLRKLTIAWGRFMPPVSEIERLAELISLSPSRATLEHIAFSSLSDYDADTITTLDSSAMFERTATHLVGLPRLSSFTLPDHCFSIRKPSEAVRLLPLLEARAFAQTRIPVSLPALYTIVAARGKYPPELSSHLALLVDNDGINLGAVPPMQEVESLGMMGHVARRGRISPRIVSRKLYLQFPSLRQISCMDITLAWLAREEVSRQLVVNVESNPVVVSRWRRLAERLNIDFSVITL